MNPSQHFLNYGKIIMTAFSGIGDAVKQLVDSKHESDKKAADALSKLAAALAAPKASDADIQAAKKEADDAKAALADLKAADQQAMDAISQELEGAQQPAQVDPSQATEPTPAAVDSAFSIPAADQPPSVPDEAMPVLVNDPVPVTTPDTVAGENTFI